MRPLHAVRRALPALGLLLVVTGCPSPTPGGTTGTGSSGTVGTGSSSAMTASTSATGASSTSSGPSSASEGGSSSGGSASSSSSVVQSGSSSTTPAGTGTVMQVVPGAARMSGGTLRMDAQLGSPTSPQKSQAGSLTLQGTTTITP